MSRARDALALGSINIEVEHVYIRLMSALCWHIGRRVNISQMWGQYNNNLLKYRN